MLIALIVIIGLSLLILGHEAAHFAAAKIFGMRVDEFGFGFPPRIRAWRPFGSAHGKRGETEYSVNWLPFGGFVKIAGERDGANEAGRPAEEDTRRYFFAQPVWKRSVVILAGVAANFIIGWLLVSAIFMIGTPRALVISDVVPRSPAASAGIKAGDVVKGFTTAGSFIAYVQEHGNEPLQFTILRGGREIAVTARAQNDSEQHKAVIGVYLAEAGTPRHDAAVALWEGLKEAGAVAYLTVSSFYLLVKNLFIHGSLLPGVVGPVGIFSVAQQSGKLGLVYLVQLLSLISVNLAVVNLIPFPALDGGRFLLLVVEKVKGSPLPRRIEGWVNAFGFAFLVLLMILITVRDVSNVL